MREVAYRYFKGDITQEPLKSMLENWKKLREPQDEKLSALFTKIPFYKDCFGGQTAFGDFWVEGIACIEDDSILEKVKNEKGYRVEFIKGKYIVKPNKRYKVGKEFSDTLDKINDLINSPPRFHVYVLKATELNIMVENYTTRRCYSSCAGVVDNTFLVCIPVKQEDGWGDDFPEIPDYLTEIKESEFLAMQGK